MGDRGVTGSLIWLIAYSEGEKNLNRSMCETKAWGGREGMFYLIGLSLQDRGPGSTVSVEVALERGSAWRNRLWNGRKYCLLFIISNF